jgi:CO/xanthine dehydrogenase Mo-binding subunit
MAEKTIGRDIVPPDLVAKITGRARYAEDFRAEGMVFAKMLLSPMPHARVRRIDASEALRMEGVLGVLTAEDVPEVSTPSEPILTMEPVYEGEPILAVAAVDEATAAEAVERIVVDLEPLPFALDPLLSLRPDGPDARLEGNIYHIDDDVREMRTHKWAAADFDDAPEGRLPMGEPAFDWSIGDVAAGLEQADVIVEETLIHQSLTHHPMEPRSCMAYWQNGKLHVHVSTQSAARCRASLAGMLDMDMEDLVVVAEFCGGGFGSKITAHPTMAMTALLSQKVGRPVMLRVTRYEENYIGRARPGFQAWAKMGFRSDGRMTGLDLYIVQDQGPYGRSGDAFTAATVASLTYQPEHMRFRGVSVFTNTPPRSAQRAPGGAQIIGMLEPLVDKAARELGMDRVAIRRLNAPASDGWVGPNKGSLTSAYPKEALDKAAEIFGWEERIARSGQTNGTRVTGIGVGLSPFVGGSTGFDGLLVIRPDGKLYVHQGIGNLGTHSIADTARAASDLLDLAWEDVVVVWGDSARHQPWSSVQAGSQTIHAHTRANHAAATQAKRKLQEIAARDLGGSPNAYEVGDGRIFQRSNPGRGMTLARAAERAIELGGAYDGHELDEDLHAMTRASATALAGTGLVSAAKDTYPHDGSTWSWVVGMAEVAIDKETGALEIMEFTGVADCGTVVHPRSLAAQIHGGCIQGFGIARSQKWVYDPKWGVPFAKRFYTARPPGILDVPLSPRWGALDIPDPQTPVGARGIGEPPVGAGSAAITSAVADALGGECLCRTPLTTDVILAAIEGTEKPYRPLETHV